MTDLAIKTESINDLDLFKMNCAALGFKHNTTGPIEDDSYVYFNLNACCF